MEPLKRKEKTMKEEQVFYKLARPDGWDFYSGKTINYRDSIGKEIICPNFDKNGDLCSSAFIHASRTPEKCFIGAKIPCSAYMVKGTPVKEDSEKCGFEGLIVIKELKPEKLFKWRYAEACNPVHPFKIMPPEIGEEQIVLVKKWVSVGDSVWDSVGDSVWDSVWDSVGDSVGDSVWASVWASVGDSVGASVGNSVWASVGAYIGWILAPIVKEWKYCEKVKTKKGQYPFQLSVDLWKMGLVPSFDGKLWRLHGGENAKILWTEEK